MRQTTHVDIGLWNFACRSCPGSSYIFQVSLNSVEGSPSCGGSKSPLPLTWPMAYTTACTTVQAVIPWKYRGSCTFILLLMPKDTETSLTVIERCSNSTPSDTLFRNSHFVLEVSSELYNLLNCLPHIGYITSISYFINTRWHSFTTVPSNAVPESSRVLFISQLFCCCISFQLLFGSLSQCKLKSRSCIYHGLMNVPWSSLADLAFLISSQDKQLELEHVCPLQCSLAHYA